MPMLVLLVSRLFVWLGYRNPNKGRKVGRQAQTIPSPCSTDDQVTVPTVEYVASFTWLGLYARTRRIDVTQVLEDCQSMATPR